MLKIVESTLEKSNKLFTFIDLFAGIGGFHLALHQIGGDCLYASEWDKYARKTYEYNFQDISPDLFSKNLFCGDITLEENQKLIPENVDLLCAGFPCQPFSQAGHKNGFFESRGTLFFEIVKIIKNKNPKCIFLENVRHLLKHDNGKTMDVISHILKNELGYTIFYKVLKACDYGLPTYRPRIYIVGFREDLKVKKFCFPSPIPLELTMSDILGGKCDKRIGYTLRVGGKGSGLHDRRNWDSYLVDGKVYSINSAQAKRLMGFPETFLFPVSETQALKQLGNSIAINPVRMIAKNLLVHIERGNNEFECE